MDGQIIIEPDLVEKVRDYISCPQFGDSHYGAWGALPLDQRKIIKRLCDLCSLQGRLLDEFEPRAREYDQIMAKRKAHAKKMVEGKSKEWLHERAVKAINARWSKKNATTK